MPTAPAQYRPAGSGSREKQWASRQTDYRGWYHLPLWKGPGGLREQAIVRDLCQCQECKRQGITTFVLLHVKRGQEHLQAHVDHRTPHGGIWERFVDMSGLETLCAGCHSRKTMSENGKKC